MKERGRREEKKLNKKQGKRQERGWRPFFFWLLKSGGKIELV